MYKELRESLKEPMKGKILGISGIDAFRPFISTSAEILDVHYPDVDMQCLPFEDNCFDFIISDQVIEHLENPQKAIQESYRVLKTGGIAIHTTCFINFIHNCPKDFWRFSPEALKYLCRDFSEVICCNGWGNRVAIILCFISNRFRFMRIPDHKWSIRYILAHHNEEKYPIVTWVAVKK